MMNFSISLALCIGITLGWLSVSILWFRRISGTFLIDDKDPTKDIFRIELIDKKIDKLPKQKYMVLEVKANVDLSQK